MSAVQLKLSPIEIAFFGEQHEALIQDMRPSSPAKSRKGLVWSDG